MSGSEAISLRKRSIAATPSIMPSSMLTSMTCAPASTCCAATVSAGVVVAVLDQLAEARGAGDVGALADVDEQALVGDGDRLEAGEPQRRARSRARARGSTPLAASAIAAMCSAVVPQQPPTMLTQPARSANSPRIAGHLLGRLVVLTEGVGQAGVGVGGDEAVGDPRQLGDVGTQLLGAERAVEPDRERLDVAHRVPERLGDLARQGAAAGVGDGAGDDDRPAAAVLLEQRLEREDRGLGVEGVEDRLDQEQVGAAVDEAAGLLEVGRDELVEGDVAGAGVVDVGRDRGGPGRSGRASRRRSAAGRRC